jgi:hypothetical protein
MKASLEVPMKNDAYNKDDDLITYNINGKSYSFRDNVQMIDVFKSIIELLPLQMYLQDEKQKRINSQQQPSTGSITN